MPLTGPRALFGQTLEPARETVSRFDTVVIWEWQSAVAIAAAGRAVGAGELKGEWQSLKAGSTRAQCDSKDFPTQPRWSS